MFALGLEPEIWSQNEYMVSTATQHQQRDEQTWKPFNPELLTVPWGGSFFLLLCCKDFRMQILEHHRFFSASKISARQFQRIGFPTRCPKHFSSTHWVSYNSLSSNTLHKDSIRSHRIRVQSHKIALQPHQTTVASPGCPFCSWLTSYGSEISVIPSLVTVSQLEWLVELSKTFYLLDHWLII